MRTVPNTTKSSHGRDGAVVLDTKHGRMFNLNPVGSRILELLKSGSAECEIIDRICSEFGARRDIVESDLRDFLLELESQHIIERNNPDAQVQEES
jgi:Coenzyme PQQ synthesis protein D (PqqD)